MSDQNQVEEKQQKIGLRHFDNSLLLQLYARAKLNDDSKTQRRINYEFQQRGKSIRKYSSQVKGLMNSMKDPEAIN
jgi:hypothetical protein